METFINKEQSMSVQKAMAAEENSRSTEETDALERSTRKVKDGDSGMDTGDTPIVSHGVLGGIAEREQGNMSRSFRDMLIRRQDGVKIGNPGIID